MGVNPAEGYFKATGQFFHGVNLLEYVNSKPTGGKDPFGLGPLADYHACTDKAKKAHKACNKKVDKVHACAEVRIAKAKATCRADCNGLWWPLQLACKILCNVGAGKSMAGADIAEATGHATCDWQKVGAIIKCDFALQNALSPKF